MLTSKRTRSVSIEHLEPIILRFVDLAVDLNKPKIIRDGLYQYKKLVQSTSIASLELVIKRFIQLSEDKVAQAQVKADKITLDADDDLEAIESPESILLSTVSSEQSKDRTDREVVTPWLKLLWEAYRISLDALRNNSKLEILYQTVVSQAFDFCIKYSRKTEFRRLCDILRLHLSNASQVKNSPAQNPIDLSDPETLQRFLDTRFRQLDVAVELELWQEAFRSVEDVHTLLNASKRPAKPAMMANYYDNLARIFLVSDNYLFHATAWSRYWGLLVQSRNVREEELVRVASLFLIATLSIPTFPQSQVRGQDDGDQRHRNSRLTNLLNLPKNPTRDSLLKQALSKNVLNYVRPEIRSLYNILEVDFHPLGIKSRVVPVIAKIANYSEYKAYFKPLYDVILTRLFQQLSQVYETVKFDFVIDLVTFPAPFDSTPVSIEKFIVRGCHKGEFNITIDHESRSITFRDDIYDETSANSSIAASASSLQLTPSEIVRTQLSRLGSTLFNVINKVDAQHIEERALLRKQAVDRALAGLHDENIETLERLKVIEERQRAAEAEQARREEEDIKAQREKLRLEREAEKERIAEDAKNRADERKKREESEIMAREKRKLAEDINSKGIISIDVNKLDELDSKQIKELQVKEFNKVSMDLKKRVSAIARHNDHLERALRLEEISKWQEDAKKQQEADKRNHESRLSALLIASKKDYEEKLALKKRLIRLLPSYQTLKDDVNSKRKGEFEQIKKDNAEKLEQEKAKRYAAVMKQRQIDREREQERVEQESRLQREKNKRIREDEERIKRERQEAAAAAAAASAPTPSPGSYVPPSARVGGAYRPPMRGPPPVAAAPAPSSDAYVPPSARAGGAYRPPVRGPPPVSSAPAPSSGTYVAPSARAGSAYRVPPRGPPPASSTGAPHSSGGSTYMEEMKRRQQERRNGN